MLAIRALLHDDPIESDLILKLFIDLFAVVIC